MSFLARIERQRAEIVAKPESPAVTTPAPIFSPLECSIIRLARADSLSTLREPGPFRRFIGWLTGSRHRPELANPHLEALRRIAVLSWHFGFTVPGRDVADFLAAGFHPDQYERLVTNIRDAAASTARRTNG